MENTTTLQSALALEMSPLLLPELPAGETSEATPPPAEAQPIRTQVRSLLSRLFNTGRPVVERRADCRYPFPFLIQLTPVDLESLEPLEKPWVVVGKSISECGLGFYHRHPLPYRHAIVTFEDASGRKISLVIAMSWCRFTRYGWYESGGRFLQVLKETPHA